MQSELSPEAEWFVVPSIGGMAAAEAHFRHKGNRVKVGSSQTDASVWVLDAFMPSDRNLSQVEPHRRISDAFEPISHCARTAAEQRLQVAWGQPNELQRVLAQPQVSVALFGSVASAGFGGCAAESGRGDCVLYDEDPGLRLARRGSPI